jgi:hypothetical protein
MRKSLPDAAQSPRFSVAMWSMLLIETLTGLHGVTSMRVLRAALVLGLILTGTEAVAQDVPGPSFDCSTAKDTLARLICSDGRLSRLDLLFVQSYQALRQQLDDTGQHDLRQEANDFQNAVYDQCRLVRDLTGLSPVPANAVPCVLDLYTQKRNVWFDRLGPPAAQEAARPVDLHVALQHDLQALGYLPVAAAIDGNYGTGTRAAIISWQTRRGLTPDGLLSDPDAILLHRDAADAQTARMQQDASLRDLAAQQQQVDQARQQAEQQRLSALADLNDRLALAAGTAEVLVSLGGSTRIVKTGDGGLALMDPAKPSRACRIAAAGADPAFMNFALHRVLGEVVSGSNEIPPSCSTDMVGTIDVLVVFNAVRSPADRDTAVTAANAVGSGIFRVAGHVTTGDWQDFLKQRQSGRSDPPRQ